LLKLLLLEGSRQGKRGLSAALELGPLLPEPGGQSGLGASLDFVLSQQWRAMALHLNNEPELARGNLSFTWQTTLIAELTEVAPVRPAVELRWEHATAPSENAYSALLGLIWTVTGDLAVDTATRLALAPEPAFEGRLGLTWTSRVWAE
jgi:hypothetical protein